MKRIIYLFALVFAFVNNNIAQNLIAVENGSTTTFYTQLDTALNYAQNGDKVYLPGGTFDASGLIINKSVNIIGVGYKPDSTTVTGPTIILGNITIINTAQGGSISGCYISTGITFGTNTTNTTLNSYKINRCLFNGNSKITFTAMNLSIITIQENIFSHYTILSANGAQLFCFNNIIAGGITNLGSNSLIKNNIFLAGSMYGGYFSIAWCRGIVVENNIFMTPCIYIYSSTFRNNINSSWMTNGIDADTNSFQNNLSLNCDSVFVNASFTSSVGCGKNYTELYDYKLKTTCPGKNAGTDGSDIGIYGGNYPWKEGGVPFTPHYQFKKVNGTTNSSGNLPIQIKVKAQDN